MSIISVNAYLATSYRPDCDYIEGEVRERNFGERPHSVMQGILAGVIHSNQRAWHVLGALELTLKITEDRYRIADIAVLCRSAPPEGITTIAPLICIEVISRQDTMIGMFERLEDYRRMGVEHVWLIDPSNRHAYIATARGLHAPPHGEYTIPGTLIRISLAEVFAEFDDIQTPSSRLISAPTNG